MRRLAILVLALATATAAALSGQAKPPKPPKPPNCERHAVGYNASGMLLSQSLTQVAGADTRGRGDDRYSGAVTVNVTRANHDAPIGEQTYALNAARAKLYDVNHDHIADVPQAGDRVKLEGKITRLKKKCDTSGFTPTIDVRSVHFKRPILPGNGGGGTCAFPDCFPDASNTGVPSGTNLTTVSGDLNVSTDGATVDAKNVTGCINVSGTGVTIQNSRAACVAMAGAARNTANPRLTIQDSEIDCGGASAGTTGVGDVNYTAIRLDVTGCENGFDADSDVTLQDSYIHDLYQGNGTDDPHTDNLQSAFGDRLLIDHNTLYGSNATACPFAPFDRPCNGTSALALDHVTSETSTDTTVRHNLLVGGGYSLYCPHDPTVNFNVTDNHFSTEFFSTVGSSGPSTNCDTNEIVSGNVYHESGLPITLD